MSPEVKKKWFNVLKFFTAYLVAAWTFLQFVDWILNRYNISPHWVDILLFIFIGISPSLLIFLYHQERISKRIIKLREKIIIPLNIAFLVIAIYFGFGNTDLGATTKDIKYTDELGESQLTTITKEEFRIGIPLYGFKNLNNDKSINWMRYGIGRLLEEDLYQNKSISPDFSFLTDTSTKIEEASLFNNFYIDGDYKKENDIYTINVYKRKATNGKILKKSVFNGPNFLALIDEITVFITENSGFIETKQIRYLDYPVNEFMSDSLEAVKQYINGNYNKAVEIDNKFALAYLANAKRSQRLGRSKLEVQDLADKAYENRVSLPLQKKLEVHIQRNLAYENYDEATKQVNLQLEVDPHNEFYNNILFSIYGETKQTEKNFERALKLFNQDQNAETGTNLSMAALVDGEDDALINEIKKYEIINSNLKVFKLQPLLFKEEFIKAETILEDIKSLFPGYKHRASIYDSAVVYLKKNGYNISRFKNFEGSYRASFSEQVHTVWIEHNRLIQYVKNQVMYPYLPAGEHIAITGFINNETIKCELLLNATGKPIGYYFTEFSYRNTNSYWFWKEDNAILKAHSAFDEGDFETALELYKVAISKNPKHSYIENIIAYLEYIKNKDTKTVQLQNETFSGDYGPRKFWIEDGKFYYKRKDSNSELAKVELLPISKNRYMDLSRFDRIMAFEEDASGKLASNSYSFIVGEEEAFEWKVSESSGDVSNYFLKDY